jgi:hypothetical protein
VVIGDVFGGSRGDEDVDEVQSGKGSSGAWSASSITSSGEGEKWPEVRARRVMARSSICCEINQKKMSEGGARERGGDRGEEEARGSPAALDSGRNGRWYLRLR